MSAHTLTFITMFREPVCSWLQTSIIARAKQQGLFTAEIVQILESVRHHHDVDDTPYGGGPGELMKINVIAPLINHALEKNSQRSRKQKRVLLMDPAGQTFNQDHAKRLAQYEELIFVCGRYEGIDARIHAYVDESISLGDFVMSNGDIAAMAIADATLRMHEGVLHNALSIDEESHMKGRLECSHYTRPLNYEGRIVPSVLQSGDHKAIAAWRRMESVVRTAILRPDLLKKYPLDVKEQELFTQGSSSHHHFPWLKIHE